MEENNKKIDWNQSPQKQVKIHFPKDIEKLTALLDWMFNSGDFATIRMANDVIEKGRKFTEIKIVEEKEKKE